MIDDRAQAADIAACRASMRGRVPDLYWASLSLPPRVRTPASVLFAFNASLLDMVDEPLVSASTTADMVERVKAALAGRPKQSPTDRAFSRVAFDHALPAALWDAMAEGLRWDVEGRRYATFEGLLDYCVRIRGTAAVALVMLMGRRKRVLLERAVDLGVAVALTIVARDVVRDARRGRVYLPLEWLEEAGIDPDRLLDARSPAPPVQSVVRRVLSSAEAFYLRADPGISALPFDCRPAVRWARYVFSALADQIERQDTTPVSTRVRLPRAARLFARALRASRSETRPLVSAPLREAEPILRAVCPD